ncbi:MAG: nicotinate-nucleotide--dimethylbenzimidazole phosphoribosyltransferase [Firmicutes bacterium]|nr:nicotinate-nucleotide--dimethylbenzimidazole phosphoribosyltransferase [Bacillota bacterium]
MNEKIIPVLKQIKPLDQEAMNRTKERLDSLTKPRGSLGRMEALAVQLAGITGDFFPVNSRKKVIVMAADHGVVKEGVSAYPQEVTLQMIANFVNGGAAINVLARQAKAELKIVDIGVIEDVNLPGVIGAKIRCGTGNFVREEAMSRLQAEEAIAVGISIAKEAVGSGVKLLATGEMGIGNTAASSAVMAALTGYEPLLVVGRGTGLNDQQLKHKVEVVKKALAVHKPDPQDPVGVLSKVGGLEIAGLSGLILGAAAERCPIIIDGFISTVAALVAIKIAPLAAAYIIPSHLSQESGHALLLNYLELIPYINLEMRLGEGTGAVLAMHLVEASARILREMATFAEAGVSGREKVKERCASAVKKY